MSCDTCEAVIGQGDEIRRCSQDAYVQHAGKFYCGEHNPIRPLPMPNRAQRRLMQKKRKAIHAGD